MKRIWIIVIALLAIVGGGAYYFFYYTPQQESESQSTSTQLVEITKGDVNVTVDVTGTVRSAQTSNLTWLTDGKVENVDVTLGQEVKEGDALGELAHDSLDDEVILAESNLVSAQQDLEDLQNSNTTAATAYKTMVAAQATYDAAVKAREYLNSGNASQEVIQAAYAEYVVAQNKVDELQINYDMMANRPDSDTVKATALSELAEAKKTRNTALYNYNYYSSPVSQEQIDAADAAVTVAKAALDDATRNYENEKDGPSEAELAAAQAKVDSYQAIIDSANLTSPIDGTITAIDSEVGDIVAGPTTDSNGNVTGSGDSAFQIDDLTHMYIDVTVSETDVNSVKVGQNATVTLDAIDGVTYSAVVSNVALIGSTSSSSDGSVSFDVTLEFTDPDDKVKTGMSAAASIITEEASDVLLVPNKAVSTDGDTKYITIQKDGVNQDVEVTTGIKGETYTEVSSDQISEGETVVITYNLASITGDTTSSQTTSNLLSGLTGSGGMGGGMPGGGMP